MPNHSDRIFKGGVLALVAVCALIGGNVLAQDDDPFYLEVIRLDKVMKKVNEFYVEKIPPKDLVQAAIGGMKTILDPHTDYFTPEKYEDLKVSTEGSFGGLGITIAVRDNVLTVISPLQGTPAYRMGLQAGDRIMEIDGKSTEGISVDEAVGKLRGKPGTAVTIKVVREGVLEPMDFTIIRDIIKIQSVPFAGMLNDTVGYVKIVQFSKNTAQDLESRIGGLKRQGMKALVLDFRYNPGGLLNQAVEVSQLFLEKGQMVVFTRGRVRDQNREYVSEREPMFPRKANLVVLVNQGSASASEIVAGALQDHDRGLILGKTSFGKGSVQTILPLDQENNALKLTTAYYYTPSGRCINKPENAVPGKKKPAAAAEEDEDGEGGEEDTAAVTADSVKYSTDGGRVVHGGGGITPDVDVEGNLFNRYISELERRSMFFNFIVKVRPRLEKGGKITAAFQPDSALIEEFRKFVLTDTNFAKYKSASGVVLEEFGKVLDKERKALGDTLPSTLNSEIDMLKGNLNELLVKKTRLEFDENLEYIRYGVKRDLFQATLGDSVRTAHELSADLQVRKALEYLADPKRFHEALVARKK